MTPLVSVITPCFNAETYIEETLQSVFSQSYKAVEILVVDDGSTDNTVKLVKAYSPRVKLIESDHHGGSVARNKGLNAAGGEYIQFLDSDDLLLKDKLRKQVSILEELNLDMVLCGAQLMDATGTNFQSLEPDWDGRVISPFPENSDLFSYFLKTPFQTSLPLHRKSALEKVGGFREGLSRGQEADLHLRLAATQLRTALIKRSLVYLRQHPRQLTKQYHPAHSYLDILTGLVERLSIQTSLSDVQRSSLAEAIHQHSIYCFRNGFKEKAFAGFRIARGTSNSYVYVERKWVKCVARCIGSEATENLLLTFRQIKNGIIS